MSIRYDVNTKARAVRLVREHRDVYESEWAAMKPALRTDRTTLSSRSASRCRAGIASRRGLCHH